MSEATAPLPAPVPPTVEELIVAHTAELRAACIKMDALLRAFDAARLAPGRQLTDTALIIALSDIKDHKKVALDIDAHIREAGEWRTVQQMHQAWQAETAPAPEPAPRSRRRTAGITGQRAAGAHRRLSAVQALKGFAPVAAAVGLVRHSRAAQVHPWIAVHAGHLVAGTVATVATGALVATTAAVVPGASLTHPFGASSAPSSVPGWQGTAEPIPGAWQIIAGASRPSVEPGLDVKSSGSSGATAPGGLAPLEPVPSSSSWPSQASQASRSSQQSQEQPVQQDAGSLQITPTTTSLDLSSGVGTITVTLTPSGSGWARWKVDTTGSDLVFSSTHGILTGTSQPATFTISLAPALDAALSQTFTVAGETFTVGLPGPPAPVVTPTDLPSLLPTDPPSPPGD